MKRTRNLRNILLIVTLIFSTFWLKISLTSIQVLNGEDGKLILNSALWRAIVALVLITIYIITLIVLVVLIPATKRKPIAPVIQQRFLDFRKLIIASILQPGDLNETPKKDDIEGPNLFEAVQQIGKIGYWRLDCLQQKIHWSLGIYKLLDLHENVIEPDLATFISFVSPNRKKQVEELFTWDHTSNLKVVDFLISTPSNKVRHCYQIATCKRDANGEVVEIEGLIQDVTDTWLAGHFNRDMQLNIQAVYESGVAGVVLADCTGAIKTFNIKAKEILEQHAGWDCTLNKSVLPELANKKDQRFADHFSLARKGQVEEFDEEYFDEAGKIIWLHFTLTPVYDGSMVTNICITARDITEMKNHIYAIQDQNRVLFEISWMQSHLVRGPLARILGLIDLLKSEVKEDEQSIEIIKYLTTSCNDLDAVIRMVTELTDKVTYRIGKTI